MQINQWIEGETPEEWADICQATLEMLDEGKLFYEDATPFLLYERADSRLSDEQLDQAHTC